MKIKSRAAIALACILALTPLTACGQQPQTEPEGDLIVTPPQETPPADEPVLPPVPEEPALPEETPPAQEPEQPEEPSAPEQPAEPPAEEQPNEPTVPVAPVVPEEPKTQTADYVRVNTNGLSIRTGAGTNYTIIGSADKNSLLIYTGRSGDWYQTRYQNRTAYVHASYASLYHVTLPNGEDKTEAVIKRGFDFLGVKYVYGATRYHDGKGNKLSGFTTTAFDCSSYMQYIFLYGGGVLLDVTSRTQSLQGTPVAKSNLKRGDLMFFTNASRYNKTGLERIGHVALYLGDNYILHTASDYARAEPITQARWNYFITARRVL